MGASSRAKRPSSVAASARRWLGDRDLAHVLHAAGHDEVGRAAHHGLRREMNGLLRRSALAIDRRSGDLVGEPRGEPTRARDVPRLRADGVDAAEDHVVDGDGVDPAPRDERLNHVRPEIGGVHLGESPVALSYRGPNRVDDEGFGHVRAPLWRPNRRAHSPPKE
jgi:hypothetical protein